MKAQTSLPHDYSEILHIDLVSQKKLALIINIFALIIAVIAVVIGCFISPVTAVFSLEIIPNENGNEFIPFANILLIETILLTEIFAYIILHEAVHGITMKLFGTKKVKYGFKGGCAFAGSDDYYGKIPYLTIALAPVVFWGIVLLALCIILPQPCFWIVYIVQIMNLSGAAGDLFVTFKFIRLPKDILVIDSGVGMTVYSKNT